MQSNYVKRMAVLGTREEVLDYFFAVLATPHMFGTRVMLGSVGQPKEEFSKEDRVTLAGFRAAFRPYIDGESRITAVSSISPPNGKNKSKGCFTLQVTDEEAPFEVVLTTTDTEVENAVPLILALINKKNTEG